MVQSNSLLFPHEAHGFMDRISGTKLRLPNCSSRKGNCQGGKPPTAIFSQRGSAPTSIFPVIWALFGRPSYARFGFSLPFLWRS